MDYRRRERRIQVERAHIADDLAFDHAFKDRRLTYNDHFSGEQPAVEETWLANGRVGIDGTILSWSICPRR
jgi:hypothetical protein